MVEEKVVRRGEVWWVDAGNFTGGEAPMGRPGIIVSGDTWNDREPTVIVAYVTSKPSPASPVTPKVNWGDGLRRAMCNQVYTVDKSRLNRKVGGLTAPEMVRVAGALAVVMQIPQYSHNAKPQPKQEEPADVVALRSECDMWRRMYEKVLDQLVDMRVAADMALLEKPPVAEQKPPAVKSEKPPVVKQKDPVPVDINHCSELALRELGLSDADVASVIACRPYESVLELNCVPDLDTGWVAANEHRFVCTPIVTETPPAMKVNINTCGGKDLMELGVSSSAAYRITSDRKRNGPFLLVSDLLRVKGVGQKFLDTWADKLEV